jgi:signal transduction histidine kinase
MAMSISFQKRTLAVFLLALTVPAALGILSFYVASRHHEAISEVSHSKDVLVQIDDILNLIVTSESSQRGFLLTGQDPYLKRFERNIDRANTQIGQLRASTSDNPVQQKNVDRLNALVTKRMALMRKVLTLRPGRGLLPDEAVAGMSEGAAVMSEISQTSRAIRSEEDRLLLQRAAMVTASRREVTGCIVTGILLNLILLYWAYRSTKQFLVARDLAEFEVRQLNAKLERRVQERTAELEAANEQLRRSNEDLTRFAYVASHDLQEPLRTVGSYAGLLARRYEGRLDDQADKYIRFVVDGAKRMQLLVQDLLEYSRTGTQALNYTKVDLGQVVQQVKDNLRLAIAERKAQITSGSLPVIDGDGAKLTLVLQNLIANALKFSKPELPPEIHIDARREADVWSVSVQDNGIGFEPAYAEKIFVIFQRLHGVGTFPGTGIGLAICKRIIEGHGGQISATSTPGVGSRFSFSIPIPHRSFVRSAPAGSSAGSWAGGTQIREGSGQNIAR